MSNTLHELFKKHFHVRHPVFLENSNDDSNILHTKIKTRLKHVYLLD